MKQIFRLSLLVIPLSFLIGSYWGFYEQEVKSLQPSTKTLRVLALHSLWAPSWKESFEKASSLHLEVSLVDDELTLLEKIREAGQDFDIFIITSLLAKTLISEDRLASIEGRELRNFYRLSPDFLGLRFDPENQYAIPLSWGVNGFVFRQDKVKTSPLSLKDVLAPAKQKRLGLLDSPTELFSFLKKTGQLSEVWVERKESQRLQASLVELQKRADWSQQSKTLYKNGDLWYLQVSHGRAASLMDEAPSKFFLPAEKATLWVGLAGLSHATPHTKQGKRFLSFLLSPQAAKEGVSETFQASTNSALDQDGQVHSMRKATYLRQLHLEKLELVTESLGFDQAWKQAMLESQSKSHLSSKK